MSESNIEMFSENHANYQRIARAVYYLIANRGAQPSLAELAAEIGLSEHHLQRTFTAWAGVSPKQFLQYLTQQHARHCLRDKSVLDAALDAGLSGGSRLHDLMIKCEGVTPGEAKRLGAGLEIRYGTHPSPLGLCFVATTERGICKLALFDDAHAGSQVLAELQSDWPDARLVPDQPGTYALIGRIFSTATVRQPLALLVRGSEFQLQVWQALLDIPSGQLRSYQDVAESIGRPRATRAVASAIARNNIGILIPCHRVIRSSGVINQYRWGSARKAALIGLEQARAAIAA